MLSLDAIAKRKLAREEASAAAALVAETAEKVSAEAREAFWDELRTRLHLMLPVETLQAKTSIEPFTDAQARAWGANRLKFGKHLGTRIDEVPLDYLEHLADPSDFQRHLRRYLASRRIQNEQANEEV